MESTRLLSSNQVADAGQKLNRYIRFLEQDGDNAQLLFDALRIAIDLNDFKLASTIAERFKATAESDSRVLSLVGHIELALGNFEISKLALQKAIAIGNCEPSAILDLAQCCNYLGQLEDAKSILENNTFLQNIFPNIFFPLFARVNYATGQTDIALTQLELFHKRFAATAESLGLLALMLFESNTRTSEALDLASKALEILPTAAEALIARSSLYLDAGQYDLARTDIDVAISAHPKNGRAWSSKAQIEFAQFSFLEAKNSAKQAVQYMSNHIGTWHLLGWSYLMLNDARAALDAFQQSYPLNDRFMETHGGLAAAYAHLGETKLAQKHIKIAEKLDASGFSAIYAKMVLLNNNQQPAESSQLFNQFISSPHGRLAKSPKSLIDKRLFELTKEQENRKKIH